MEVAMTQSVAVDEDIHVCLMHEEYAIRHVVYAWAKQVVELGFPAYSVSFDTFEHITIFARFQLLNCRICPKLDLAPISLILAHSQVVDEKTTHFLWSRDLFIRAGLNFLIFCIETKINITYTL